MIRNKLIGKKICAVVLSAAMVLPAGIPAVNVKADEPTAEAYKTAYVDKGYHFVWGDEFDGDSLNTEDWNVEARKKGWVNGELQRYVASDEMDDNIQVSEGTLKIKPKAEKKETASASNAGQDILAGNSFDDTWSGASATIEDGKALISVPESMSGNPWDVQFQKAGMTLVEGHKYTFSVKAKADVARKIQLNITDTRNYSPYTNEFFEIGKEEDTYSLTFTMGECAEGKVAIQFNLGKFDETTLGSGAADLELYDAVLIDESLNVGSNLEFFEDNKFDDSWSGADATIEEGKALISVPNSTSGNPWDVQFQKAGMTLVEGHKYTFSMKAKADVARKIQLNITDTRNYSPYTNEFFEIGTEEDTYSLTFTMGECAEGKVAIQFNLGKFDETTLGSGSANLQLYDVSLVDNTASSSGAESISNYNFTSGRINTQGKHDFTYGRFEASVKVPKGQGYLPAFWLMATDEDNYGQWPKCGEIDIMEIMGQNTQKTYHTIHYGYDSGANHKENQKINPTDVDFSSEFHVFAVDWEPGLITWYIDGVEVYQTNRWYTGTDDESQLTYPAPFDQNFYVILNLAVGGNWVHDPSMDTVNNMDKVAYEVDYVRVYQKDESVYEEAEANLKAPEKEQVVFRTEDEGGNYVLNGDFATDINRENDPSENWILHLEEDCAESTATVSDNAITITPSSEGLETYSVQLKQEKVPMYRGWTYELSFDAVSTEKRNIVVDISGPDYSYTRYMSDTTFEVTTEKQTFTKEFTMNNKTDANGSLEFNLGKQKSTAPVTISNVKVVHKSGDLIPEDTSKQIRADGNYIYNGSFDQGEKRLGYWELEEGETRVSVTNKNNVRELCAKIEVPEGTSEIEPVVISQSELAPLAKGEYRISFDAYMAEGGSSDALEVDVAGMTYEPVLTTEKSAYSKKLAVTSDISRKDSNVSFTFTKPGTYYLDNVMLAEDAMIKNGSFAAGKVGYEFWYDSTADASWGVDSITEKNTAAVVTVKKTGDQDYMVQLKQNDVKLEKNHVYKLQFDARATMDRQIRVIMQGGESLRWPVYSSDNIVSLTSKYQTFEDEFVMTAETDAAAFLSICMGKVDKEIDTEHNVCIDNISLVDLGEASSSEEETETEPKVEPKEEPKSEPKQEAPKTTTPAPTPANDNGNGVVEVGEKAVTEQGTFTAISDKAVAFTPSEEAKNAETNVIPDTVKIDGVEVPVTTVAENAYKDSAVKEVTLGKNITSISASAFENAKKLTKVKTKTNKITTIGKNAFAGASSLKNVDLSKQSNLTTIGDYAFGKCKNLVNIKVNGNKLKKVSKKAFKEAKNKKSVKVTIVAKSGKKFKKVVKMLKKAGLSKATFKRKKK